MADRRILIVEDDPDVLEITRLSLEMVAGWEVIAATSGREGVAYAEAERPDAILLDIMMPDMDGRATLRALRSRPATRAVPVILLSAKLQPTDLADSAELGIAGSIMKPYDPLALPARIAALLGWA